MQRLCDRADDRRGDRVPAFWLHAVYHRRSGISRGEQDGRLGDAAASKVWRLRISRGEPGPIQTKVGARYRRVRIPRGAPDVDSQRIRFADTHALDLNL